jgi:hypothetical protein
MNHGATVAEHPSSLAAVLDEIACDRNGAPYVARGTLGSEFGVSRLDDAGPAALGLINKMLDPLATNYPDAIGLGEEELVARFNQSERIW